MSSLNPGLLGFHETTGAGDIYLSQFSHRFIASFCTLSSLEFATAGA